MCACCKHAIRAVGEVLYLGGKPSSATLPKDRKEEPVKYLAYALANWSHVATGSASYIDVAAENAEAAAKAAGRLKMGRGTKRNTRSQADPSQTTGKHVT